MTEATRPLTVGAVARLAGVTVRTLHHYDEIGLLVPSERSAGGYRAYTGADVARLQRILFYRELELPLDRIHQLIDDPEADERDHLRRQHHLLGERINRLQRIREAVQTTMEAHDMSINLTPEERLEVFGDHDPSQYDAEARDRWGETDAYAQSAARTRNYSKEDWLRIKAAGEEIEAQLAAAMQAGEEATSDVAMDLAAQYLQHMASSYFDGVVRIRRELADMWVDDPRFKQHYDDRAAGLAEFVRDAVHAHADREGVPRT
ncbi:MAG: MerR family transcriptional regulator [Solirubrobacteraceae bacterium]|nr:MerR family transcriptional regulator [Solirubrobacteraceae bacterium]